MHGSPASIVQQQNSNDTIVAYSQHSCTALSAGKWQIKTNQICQLSITNARDVFLEYSGPTLSTTKNYWESATNLTWRQYLREGGNGWVISLGKTVYHIPKQHFTAWTPDGKRKRGRPKTTWRQTVEAVLNEMNQTWGTAEWMAKDRHQWRAFVAALHASRHNGQ